MRLLTAVVLLLCFTAVSADETRTVQFSWTAPTTGSLVQHYVVQLQLDGGLWNTVGTTADTTYAVPCVLGRVNCVRVAGVDSVGRQGIFSDSSLPVDMRATGVPLDDVVIVQKSTGCFRGRK